jgi:hypothetical protein
MANGKWQPAAGKRQKVKAKAQKLGVLSKAKQKEFKKSLKIA